MEWHVADIEENIAIERTRLAHLRLEQAQNRFISALAEVEGVYANADEMTVIVPRMEVWKVDKAALRNALPRKVVEFAHAMARGDVVVDDVARGRIPSQFKELRLAGDYAKDLANFLVRTGDDGKAILKTICEDMAYATDLSERGCPRDIADSDKVPLQFLARQVIATHAPRGILNGTRQKVGFCVS